MTLFAAATAFVSGSLLTYLLTSWTYRSRLKEWNFDLSVQEANDRANYLNTLAREKVNILALNSPDHLETVYRRVERRIGEIENMNESDLRSIRQDIEVRYPRYDDFDKIDLKIEAPWSIGSLRLDFEEIGDGLTDILVFIDIQRRAYTNWCSFTSKFDANRVDFLINNLRENSHQ